METNERHRKQGTPQNIRKARESEEIDRKQVKQQKAGKAIESKRGKP